MVAPNQLAGPSEPATDPTRRERLASGCARTRDVARMLASKANRARIVATPVVKAWAVRTARLSRQAYAAGQKAHGEFQKAQQPPRRSGRRSRTSR